jgi:hypothetical protein
MARKPRNYKAEYARKKARSQAKGYRNPGEEYRARKALGITAPGFRRVSTPGRKALPSRVIETLTGTKLSALRKESQEWSDKHSHVKASRYRSSFSAKRVEDYHKAYVQRPDPNLSRRKRAIAKRIAIYNYLTAYGFPVEGGPEDWKSDETPA